MQWNFPTSCWLFSKEKIQRSPFMSQLDVDWIQFFNFAHPMNPILKPCFDCFVFVCWSSQFPFIKSSRAIESLSLHAQEAWLRKNIKNKITVIKKYRDSNSKPSLFLDIFWNNSRSFLSFKIYIFIFKKFVYKYTHILFIIGNNWK